MLAAARISSPEDVAAYWSGPISSLAPLARGATLNRDDRPVVEYRAPRDLVAVGNASLGGAPGATRLVPFDEHMPDGAVFGAWPREDWYARRARHLIALADTARARIAIGGARAEGFAALAVRLEGEVDAGVRRQTSDMALRQGMNLIALGRVAEGTREFERAAKLDPTYPRAWFLLSERRCLAGDLPGAEDALARVVAGEDRMMRANVATIRGMLALARRDTLAALASIDLAESLSPGNARLYVSEAWLRVNRGDIAGARAALQQGLVALPGNPEITQVMTRMGW
jgi:Flp pilus assembly protein TadD